MKILGNTRLTLWVFFLCLFTVSLHENYLEGNLAPKEMMQVQKPKTYKPQDEHTFRKEMPDAQFTGL